MEPKVYPPTSFTPINRSQIPVQGPLSRSTLSATAKRGPVYELQEESGPEVPNSHEQVCTSTNQSASFVDMSINGALARHKEVEFQEPAPKRKKHVSQMRSQSLKNFTGESEMDSVPPSKSCENDTQEYHRQLASKVTTSVDTFKRRKGRDALFTPGSNMKQNSPFQNASVIRSSTPKGKESLSVLPTQSLTQQKQFTTTEQQLSLSKSTLERLSSFRYKPQLDDQASTTEVLAIDSEPTETCLSHSDLEHYDKPYYNKTYSSGNDSMHELMETSISEGEFDLTDAQSTRYKQYIEARGNISQKTDLPDNLDIDTSNTAANIHHYNVKLPNSYSNHVPGSDIEVEGPIPTVERANNTFPCLATEIEESTNFLEYEASKVHSGPHFEKGDTIDSSKASNTNLPENTCQTPIIERCCDSALTGQSDVGSYEIVSGHGSKDSYANHTFDEGLNDDDFIGISLGSSMPTVSPEFNGNLPFDKFQKPHISQAAVECHSRSQMNDFALLTPNGSTDDNPPRGSLTSNTAAVLETVDEFCIDEEDEDLLLKLTYPPGYPDISKVTERFEPPTSVQGAMCNGTEGSEVYDSALQFFLLKYQALSSPPNLLYGYCTNNRREQSPREITNLEPPPVTDGGDWSIIRPHERDPFRDTPEKATHLSTPFSLPQSGCTSRQGREQIMTSRNHANSTHSMFDDSYEYEALRPFARPTFPTLIPDRSPVVGFSSHPCLRVCFRIGEMYKEGAKCNALGIEAVIELFARVGFSSREAGTIKQHFQFLDLWHDRPPIVSGILASYKTTPLAETESKVFLDGRSGKMARCLGRFKRNSGSNTGWLLHIINIRETDWEEIRWTRRIVSGGLLDVP